MGKEKSRTTEKKVMSIILTFSMTFLLCVLIMIVPMDAGYNYVYTDNSEIFMDFRSDFFIVNGKGTGIVYISFSNTDINDVKLVESDIYFKGFSATVTYFNLSEYREDVTCLISLSKITSISDIKKSIQLKEGVATIHGKYSPRLELELFNSHFISMQQFITINILVSIVFSVLFFIYAIRCRVGDIAKSVLLWIDIIACWNLPFVLHKKIIEINPDYFYTCFVLLLVAIELSFYLWVGKKILKSRGYSLFIILFATLVIVNLSQLFSVYYLRFGQLHNLPSIVSASIDSNFDYDNLFSYRLNSILYDIIISFKYFFSFPQDEYYGPVAILQFCIGKVYEIVVFGSVGSIILEHARKRAPK